MLTKQDLESIGEIIDKKMPAYQQAIVEAVDFRFKTFETHFDQRLRAVETELSGLRSDMRKLAVTLDNFVKSISDQKEEFAILKAEVDQIKQAIQEKLGVKIAVQR